MRTIKFKAKRLDNGEWMEGYYRGNDEGKAFISRIKRPPLLFEVDPSTVQQFTASLDKNGEEIYEGDVLRSDEYPYSCLEDGKRDNYFGVVFYDEQVSAFCLLTVKNLEASVKGISDGISDFITQNELKNFEVVGNIYNSEWKLYGEYL